MTADLLPCEQDTHDEIHDRAIEIRTLNEAARSIVDISPIAARALRDAARLLLKEQYKAIRALTPAERRRL